MHRCAKGQLALTLAIAFSLVAPVVILAATPPDTYIRAGHLLDVRAGKMLSNQIIVIHGEKIASIAPADQIQIPPGANVIDLTQSTVLPGLIDCHTHIMLTDTDDSHYDDILLKQSWQYRTILATLNVKNAPSKPASPPCATSKPKARCTATSTFATQSIRDSSPALA